MNKDKFYIIYHYDNKELPYMLCDTLNDVATALGYSKRMIQHGINKGYVYTTETEERYTVSSWNMKDLQGA